MVSSFLLLQIGLDYAVRSTKIAPTIDRTTAAAFPNARTVFGGLASLAAASRTTIVFHLSPPHRLHTYSIRRGARYVKGLEQKTCMMAHFFNGNYYTDDNIYHISAQVG